MNKKGPKPSQQINTEIVTSPIVHPSTSINDTG